MLGEFIIKKIIISMLVFLAVFSLLSGMLWIQAANVAREDTRLAAENMRNYVRLLLQEADQAARTSVRIPSTGCTEQERNSLSGIIAGAPHLHSITRIINGHSSCSSLTGQMVRDLSHIPFTQHLLSLQTWQAPGSSHPYPLLILTMSSGDNARSDIGIDGIFLQNHMRFPLATHPLWIRVGNNMLGPQGVEWNVRTSLPAHSRELKDPTLPFSVLYSTDSGLSAGIFIHTWPLPLGGALILGLIAGAFCYRQLSRQFSPRLTLLKAIRKGEIRTIYQPIVSSSDGGIVGVEALCRWHHPTDGVISPDVFIPMMEQTGLIVLLTQYQLEQIAQDMIIIAPLLGRPFYVSVNFSQKHYTSGTFLHDCDHLIKTLRQSGCQLVVEITEREELKMTPEITKRFTWLRSAGVAIALDDFGTGYSNLSYIASLKPDYLKIDKMFVSHMRPGHTMLLDCVIELAAKLRISTIAEGIETQEQAAYLKEKGVNSQQGFYWHRPADREALIVSIKNWQHQAYSARLHK